MSDLAALRDRVRAAEGADRSLDAEIWFAFADHSETDADVLKQAKRHKGEIGKLFSAWFPGWRDNEAFVPRYTASIDAALRLVELKLPGWIGSIYFGDGEYVHKGGAQLNQLVRTPEGTLLDGGREIHETANSPALAILAALLTALSEGANTEARRG